MTYKEYIENLKAEFVGKKVQYDGRVYTIVKVDYNGCIHIDKPSEYNDTTAIWSMPHEARKAFV